MSYEKLKAHMVALIAEQGMAVNPVMASGNTPCFAYTMGLHAKGLPELVVFGLPPQVAGGLLYELTAYLVRELAAGRPVGPGEVTLDGVAVPTALLEVEGATAREYATVADDLSQGQAKYLQAVWPAPDGIFPWEAGYPEHLRPHQLILGAPPVSSSADKSTLKTKKAFHWAPFPGPGLSRQLH
jgi:hypothetical protein